MRKYWFLFFSVLLISTGLLAETYSDYRIDDLKYAGSGMVGLTGRGRLASIQDSIQKKSETENDQDGFSFYNLNYMNARFFSQKGGAPSDKAAMYSYTGILNPEISVAYRKSNLQLLFLLAPSVDYTEEYISNRKITKSQNVEAIAGAYYESKSYSLRFEAGRGFQRLDSFGVFFAGIVDFAEMSGGFRDYGVRLSATGISYSPDKQLLTSENISNGNKLYGSSLLFSKIPFISSLNFFYYRLYEPLQVSEKSGFNFGRKDFHPFGDFAYRGFEVSTDRFLKLIKFDAGLFSVTGYRNMSEYSNRQFDSRVPTSGGLVYAQQEFKFDVSTIRIGGLKSSKERNRVGEKSADGYSGILAEPRIFGGRGSFLLNENTDGNESRIFDTANGKSRNEYSNKGMDLVSLNYSYRAMDALNFSFFLNHSTSALGTGNELILMGVYTIGSELEHAKNFILFSGCQAFVKPNDREKIFFDEITKNAPTKEFVRFYFAGGVRF